MFKSEKGVSAVEFALIAPLLFVITFGIIEFGILLFDKAVVTNASREGARKAILFNTDVNGQPDPIPVEDIEAVVSRYANDYLISFVPDDTPPPPVIEYFDPADPLTPIDPPCVDPCGSGWDVRVTVNYTYDFLLFPNLLSLLGSSFDGTKDLAGITRMRME